MSNYTLRVYYEDTDAGGIVYYANYLKFAERARTEALRELDWEQTRLRAEHNLLFVVRRVAVDYHAPARLDDVVTVETAIKGCGAATLDMAQRILHEGVRLADLQVTLAAVTPDGRVIRMPKLLRDVLTNAII